MFCNDYLKLLVLPKWRLYDYRDVLRKGANTAGRGEVPKQERKGDQARGVRSHL